MTLQAIAGGIVIIFFVISILSTAVGTALLDKEKIDEANGVQEADVAPAK